MDGRKNFQLRESVENWDYFSQPVFLETEEGKREMVFDVYLPKPFAENERPPERLV